jgi:TolB-like protein
MRYKGKEFDSQKIAAELGVQAVMSGRIVQRGDNLSISVELIDAINNKTIWGEQFERKMSDLLATQREIASSSRRNSSSNSPAPRTRGLQKSTPTTTRRTSFT